MELVYKTVITNIGKNAKEFFSHNMFITFKGDAPEELIDYCFIHDENVLYTDIHKKDILKIDGKAFEITAVGEAVNPNLKELGHITLKFTGENEANVAGTLFIESSDIPSIEIGSVIEIVRA